jgi:hypothetical protein
MMAVYCFPFLWILIALLFYDLITAAFKGLDQLEVQRCRVSMASCSSESNESKGERVGGYSLGGLAQTWDDCQDVRNRLRNEYDLVVKGDGNDGISNGHVDKNMANVVANSFVLSPILKLMAENGRRVPGIDDLLPEVSLVYDFNKIITDEAKWYKDAWAIRRLLTYVKAMIWRPAPPRDPDNCQNPFPQNFAHKFYVHRAFHRCHTYRNCNKE